MKKILYIAISSQTGGVPKHILNALKRAKEFGYEITVAAPKDGDYYRWFQEYSSEMINISLKPYSVVSLWKLRQYIKHNKIELVHSHGKGAGMYARPLRVLCPGIKVVHTFHGIYLEQYGTALKRVYCFIERILRHWTDTFICVSESEREEALRWGFAFPNAIKVIANGVDLELYKNEMVNRSIYFNEFELPQNAYVIGCVARLEVMKGHEYLLRAFEIINRKYHQTRLILIGDGPARQEIENLIKELQLENKVVLAGFRHDVPKLLKIMDLFVSASLKEGMPYTLIEALAAGVPVVATDVIGNRDVVGDGKEGFLVCPKDENSLAEGMEKAITQRELCREYVLAGQKKVERDLTVESSVKHLFEVYKGLLKEK